MANLLFKSMFGGIPKTSKLEEKRAQLIDQYEEFLTIEKSDELKEYYELDELVNSDDFVNKKKEIQELTFKGTEQHQKLKEYEALTKSKRIKNYYKVLASPELERFNSIHNSDTLARYNELDAFINSDEFEEIKTTLANKWAEEEGKLKEFKRLDKSKKIRDYYKTKASPLLANYNELDGSETIQEFEELKQFVSSGEFNEHKQKIKEEKKAEDAKVKEYNRLKKSKELEKEEEEADQSVVSRFKELDAYINSDEFKEKQNSLVLENTEEFQKFKKYNELKKDTNIKDYYTFKKSKKLSDFQQLDGSKEITDYEELKAYVTAPDFETQLNELKFENTEEYKKHQEYLQLKKSDDIKFYFKFQDKPHYKLYKELEESEELAHYEALKELVASQEFLDFKDYMEDKKKWEKTEEYQKEIRYNELKNADNIKKYLKLKDSDIFNVLKEWEVTFEEDFTEAKLDESKWMTSFFWGKALLNESYSLEGDYHFNTEGENIELDGNTLKIVTRKENRKGKTWNPNVGFVPKDFEYTSGLISTGNGFRQQYGKFEAKIKVANAHPSYHAFWMVGEKIVPHINILNYKGKSTSVSNHFQNNGSTGKNVAKASALNLGKDYFIYTLEWTPEKLVWKINEVEVNQTSTGIPEEPLYLVFSAGLTGNIDDSKLPVNMEIDWIRCYQKKDSE